MVLPVDVFQAEAWQAPGTYVTDDGDILFITHGGRAVLAYPMVADLPFLLEAAADKKLRIEFDEEANVIMLPSNGDHYYVGRPFSAVAAPAGEREGLVSRPLQGFSNVTEHSIIFREGEDRLMQQALVPRPADWPGFKAMLLATPSIEEVRIDAQGVISARSAGSLIRGRASYRVNAGGRPGAGGRISLEPAGDLNGDGTADYLIKYPNGDTQMLYIYPSQG